jgi:peptidoglycan/LPS O-acetylase OafA/YrhL
MSAIRNHHRIASLDGLRALSVLVVFLNHVGLRRWPLPGDLGVTAFFLLSGYLITTLLRREYQTYGSVSLRAFYARRALRILPPLYLVLAVAVIVAHLVDEDARVGHWPLAALMLNLTNYWLAAFGSNGFPPGTERYWSLAVEEHFYLLYPGLYLLLRRAGMSGARQAVVLWGLCALMLLWRCVLVYFVRVPGYYILLASDTRGDLLLFGCALGAWCNPLFEPTRIAEQVWKTWLVPACLLAMTGSVLWHNVQYRDTWYFTLQGVALSPLLIAAIRYPHWPIFRWLNLRPVAFLGELSYSLYLIHDVCLRALASLWPQLPAAIRMLPALALSVLIAALIYAGIERPCARLRARLGGRGRSRGRVLEAETESKRHELLPVAGAIGTDMKISGLDEE